MTMILGLQLLLMSVVQLIVVVASGEVPSSQITGLEFIYNSTNGTFWNWIPDYSNYGIPWNFSSVNGNISNPCVDRWQGIECTTNCTTDSSIPVCDIKTIYLFNFSMMGSLPSEISLLPKLNNLIIPLNTLTGSVPTEIAMLTELHVLNVTFNSLTGPIFETVLANHQLAVLGVSENFFNGTIPNSLNARIPNLAVIDGHFNYISGSIPTCIGALADLEVFFMGFNEMTGVIPTEIGNVGHLQVFSVDFNSLEGGLPAEIGNIQSLVIISCYSANLGGSLPTELGNLSNLYAMAIAFNSFTGTIPTSFGSLSSMQFFGVNENSFTGSSDGLAAVAGLPNLHNFLVSWNAFTGDFANAYFAPTLEVIRLDNNKFTGPDAFSRLCTSPAVLELLMLNNEFSGSVPSCIGDFSVLVIMDISGNNFEGSLPDTLPLLSNLSIVIMGDNFLTGQVEGLFVADYLTTVVLSDNQFTGTLPYDVFNSSLKLESFSATKNCFSGSLSSEICFATGLVSLDISGLTSGTSCVVTTIFGTYDIKAVPGAIPVCIFEMPNLEAFYAAGNGIASPLFDNIPASSVLRNLSLSNNRITGPIPYSLQTHKGMHLLDLSHNRLLGTIEHMGDFTLDNNTDLILKANQLSGFIPESFEEAPAQINILAGNLFDCETGKSLPDNDPSKEKYTCGSDLLDGTVFFTVGMSVVLLFVMISVIFYHQRNKTLASKDITSFLYETMYAVIEYSFSKHVPVELFNSAKTSIEEMQIVIDRLALVLFQFRSFALFLTVLVCVVFLPIFVSLKEVNGGEYSKVTYQHGWDVSLAYLQGVPPGVYLTCAWLFVIVAATLYEFRFIDRRPFVLYTRYSEALSKQSLSSVTTDSSSVTVTQDHRRLVTAKADKFSWTDTAWNVTLNVCMSFLVNGIYVYIVIAQTVAVQTVAVMLLVMYKLGWLYLVVVPWFERIQSHFVIVMSVMIANVVLLPMVATMMVDVSCFQYMFILQDPIESHFSFPLCLLFWEERSCLVMGDFDVLVSFAAPNIYNNNCFSALLYNYVPIYVVTYGVIGILVPVLQMMANVYYHAYRNEYKDFIHRSKQVEWFPMFFMLPITGIEDLVSSGDLAAGMNRHRPNFYLARYNSLSICIVLVLLLTFGLAYPPLAVILLANLALTTLAFQLSLYVHSKQVVDLSEECFEIWLRICEDEICDMHKIIYGSRAVIYVFSAFFACFAIYDITALYDYDLSLVLASLLVVLTIGSVELSGYLRGKMMTVDHPRPSEIPAAVGERKTVEVEMNSSPYVYSAGTTTTAVNNPLHR